MIQGFSSFSVLAAFATGKRKVVVTDKSWSEKYLQHFKPVVDLVLPTEKFRIKCPLESIGSNFAADEA